MPQKKVGNTALASEIVKSREINASWETRVDMYFLGLKGG